MYDISPLRFPKVHKLRKTILSMELPRHLPLALPFPILVLRPYDGQGRRFREALSVPRHTPGLALGLAKLESDDRKISSNGDNAFAPHARFLPRLRRRQLGHTNPRRARPRRARQRGHGSEQALEQFEFPEHRPGFQLRQRKIENLVLAGTTANTCLENTSRYAYKLGYHVTMLKDATVGWSKEQVDATTGLTTMGEWIKEVEEGRSKGK